MFSIVAHPTHGICRGENHSFLHFQDGVDEKIGSEMQSGLPWGSQWSLKDTYHGPVPLCPLPLTADLEWAQSLGDSSCLVMPLTVKNGWNLDRMWPSPSGELLGPRPQMCWASQTWSPPSCEELVTSVTHGPPRQRGETPGQIIG